MKLAVDIGGSTFRYATGNRNNHKTHDIPSYDGTQSYDELIQQLIALTKETSPQTMHVAAPGPIYPPGIISPSDAPSPNIPWSDKPIQHDLNDQLDIPVYVQRDLFCAAEGLVTETDSETFTLIYPGTGFGYATVIDGHVVTGTNNVAGELAQQQANNQTYDDRLSLSQLQRLDDENRSPKTILKRPVTQPLTDYLQQLSSHVAPLINVVATPNVFIGGHLAEHWQSVKPQLEQGITERLPYDPSIQPTNETPLRGAFILGERQLHF